MTRALLLLLIVVSPATATAERVLGRLFTTPEERQFLDRGRGVQSAQAEVEQTETVPTRMQTNSEPATRYTVSGLIRRSDGSDVAWVNGSAVTGTATREGVTVLLDRAASGHVPLLLPGRSEPVLLKPGQVLDTATGQVHDLYSAPPPPTSQTNEGGEGADL